MNIFPFYAFVAFIWPVLLYFKPLLPCNHIQTNVEKAMEVNLERKLRVMPQWLSTLTTFGQLLQPSWFQM